MRSSGLSPRGLGRLHDVLAAHVERGVAPGLVALVSRRGEVHVEAIGTTAVGGGEPTRRDSLFRISSMTKPMTAVATLILLEECRLRLDDPVDSWLPELADRRVLRRLDAALDDTVPAARSITVRDLLTFTMGFGMVLAPPGSLPVLDAIEAAGFAPGPPEPGRAPEPDEWLRRLGTLPLLSQPGTQWHYHTGSEVLGVLIARVSGQPFEAFLHERLFAPIGMVDTGFWVGPTEIGRLAAGYFTDPENAALHLYDRGPDGPWSRPPRFANGADGLVSTVDDVARFGQMLLDGGRVGRSRLVSRRAVELMTTDQLTAAQKAASDAMPGFFAAHGWGFGVSVVTARTSLDTTPGRFGWDGGLGTAWSSDPAEDMVAVLMTQAAWTSPQPPPVCVDFRTAAYAAIDD